MRRTGAVSLAPCRAGAVALASTALSSAPGGGPRAGLACGRDPRRSAPLWTAVGALSRTSKVSFYLHHVNFYFTFKSELPLPGFYSTILSASFWPLFRILASYL